ncbi:MAG: ribosome maturation factor RimM [Chloroflexota bacterium]|jgi:16S rRNA processing protein RimM
MTKKSRPGISDVIRGYTGSPPSGEPVFLAVGRLRRAHGLHGEMVMDILTDFPERLSVGKLVYVGEAHLPMVIHSMRPKDKEVLISFAEIISPEATVPFRNQYLFVRSDEIPPLPEGEYYHHQLLGLAAVSLQGEHLGTLVEILDTGAKDVYVIRLNETGEELLLPAVEPFVLKIDLDNKKIIVSPPEWY